MTEHDAPDVAGELGDHLAAGWTFPAHLKEQLAALRADFPPEQIGKLPRIVCGACSDARGKACGAHPKANCAACGQWMTPRHIHLDFVGHADVTDRLLKVDPLWSWEPIPNPEALGYPVAPGGMWIYLTVCGVTRPGFGDAEGRGGTQAIKIVIGDALRNAAMRFGVALELWAKGDRKYNTEGGAAADAEQIARANARPAVQAVRDEQDRAAEQPRPAAVERAEQDRAAELPDAGAVSDPETVATLQQDIAAAEDKTSLTTVWRAIKAAQQSGALRPDDARAMFERWEHRRDAVMTPAAAGAPASNGKAT